MLEANLPEKFWAEAIYTANYLINRSPAKALKGGTPYGKWTERTPSGNHLHIFGSKAFVLNKTRRGKFTPKAQEGIFVGYAQNAKGFRVFIPEKGNIVISRDVKFIDKMYYESTNDTNYNFLNKPEQLQSETEKEALINSKRNEKRPTVEVETILTKRQKPVTVEVMPPTEVDIIQLPQDREEAEDTLREEEQFTGIRTSQRKRTTPVYLKDYELNTSTTSEEYLDPESSMISDENDEVWHNAIKDEIRAHIKNDTWVISKRDHNMKTVDFKMVLRTKTGPEGSKRKARLVARGFSQRPGIDYDETYAPTSRLSSVRTVLALSVEENLKLFQMDVTTAYLNGNLDEKIFMNKPDYLEKYIMDIMTTEEDPTVLVKARKMLEDCTKIKDEKVCELKKSIYGLKQSGRQWFLKLDNELQNIGFIPSQADPCVYVLRKGKEKVILAAYVDDLLLAYSTDSILKSVQEMLKSKFEMKDLGKPQQLIGFEIQENKDSVQINQAKYIDKVLEKFNMVHCKPVVTPIEPNLKLELKEPCSDLPYQNLIGSLMFIAVATRPDIMYAVSYLSQFNKSHGEEHFRCAKRVLRYLKGTKTYAIVYKKTGKDMFGMADADWASCTLNRKSYTGYCFKFGNSPVSWESQKQKTTAMSTAEAEYLALTEAAKQAIHLKALLNHIANNEQQEMLLYSDSQAALAICKNDVRSRKTRHMDLRVHFLKECAEIHHIKMEYMETGAMEADLLTKGLPGPRLKKLVQGLGLQREAAC